MDDAPKPVTRSSGTVDRAPQTENAPAEVSPWALAGLGMQFFVALLLFVYVGNWMDARSRREPMRLPSGEGRRQADRQPD